MAKLVTLATAVVTALNGQTFTPGLPKAVIKYRPELNLETQTNLGIFVRPVNCPKELVSVGEYATPFQVDVILQKKLDNPSDPEDIDSLVGSVEDVWNFLLTANIDSDAEVDSVESQSQDDTLYDWSMLYEFDVFYAVLRVTLKQTGGTA